jgi:flagellar basal-body rod modification protein FlgD
MAVSGIGIVTPSSAQTPPTQSLSEQDFLNIMITQLQFQDPLQPVDDTQFVAQLAQFSALEVNTEENTSINTLLSFASADQGIHLLGQTVEVNDSQTGASTTANASGTVTAVDFSTGQPLLTVQTNSNTLTAIPLTNVTLVQHASSTQP